MLILQPGKHCILFLFTINVLWVTQCTMGPLNKALSVVRYFEYKLNVHYMQSLSLTVLVMHYWNVIRRYLSSTAAFVLA